MAFPEGSEVPHPPGAVRNAMPLRLGLTVLLPLVFVPWAHEVRESPRELLLRFIALGVLAAAAARPRPLSIRRLALPLAVAAALLTASLLSDQPWRALLGPFPHGDSALGYLAYLVLLLVAPSRGALPAWIGSLVLLGAGQALFGFGQRQFLGLEAAGTLGHPAFLAAMSVAAALAAFGWLLDAEDRRLRLFIGVAALLCIGGVALTARRAPIAALLAGGLVLVAFHPRRKRLLGWGALAAAAGILVGTLLTAQDGATSAARWLGNDELALSFQTRLDVYRVAWSRLLERPLFGWGFGSFRDFYAAEKSASLGFFEGRAHSLPLELGLGAGFVGLACVSALGVSLWPRLRDALAAGRTDPRQGGRTLACVAVGFAYLVHLLLHFDQPGVGVWVASLASFALSPGTEPSTARAPRWRLACCTAVAVVLGAMLARPLVANLAIGLGTAAEARGEVDDALAHYRRAGGWAPTECQAELKLCTLLRAHSQTLSSASERIAVLESCLQRHPEHPFVHYHLGLALTDASPADPTLLLRAREEMARAVELAPSHGVFLRGLARALAQAGELEEALRRLDRAVELEGGEARNYNDRGNVLYFLGRKEDALKSYERAAELDPATLLYRRNVDRVRAEVGAQ